ncbi:hypothetical protein [Sphingomonas bacterium]|uniref:hypothetical protein n=1 Tax=Sphingomonas bacterium TaxID=1895847 RepID=UPI0020C6FE69|nr:hypothetical protein [Sphingomonas bacterium]
MRRRTFIAALLAIALAPAPASAAPCLTAPEAESIALVAMPEIIRETGTICVDRLPPASLIRQRQGAFIDRFDAAAARAWPDAQAAIVKLSDPMVQTLLQSDYARPLLVTLLVPQLVGRIDTGDCAMIDRLVTELAPLPPRNAAGVVVTALQYLKAQKAKGKSVSVPNLPLCAEPR